MGDKKQQISFTIKVVRFIYPILEKYAFFFAKKWAIKLFFQPFKYKYSEDELRVLQSANVSTFLYKQQKIQLYKWGDGTKKIILMHGWAGRATQFWMYIDLFLQDQDYQLIAFDAPAHGKSEGKITDLVQFSEVLKLVIEKENSSIEAIIAHSLGASASFYTLESYVLNVKKLVFMAGPTSSKLLLKEFLRRINASDKTGRVLSHTIERLYGHKLSHFFAETTTKMLTEVEIFAAFDKDDIEVTLEHLYILQKSVNNISYDLSEGYGHKRIIKNPELLKKVSLLIK